MIRHRIVPALTRSVSSIIGLVLFHLPTIAFAQVQLDNHVAATIGGEALQWSSAVATDANDSLLVVMTDADPVLHIFAIENGAHIASWGRNGDGPGEFQSSAGVALVKHRIYALDTTLRRIAIFSLTGVHIQTIMLDEMSYPFADRLHRAKGDTLFIGTFEPMGNGRAVVAWTSSGHTSEVLAFQAATPDDQVRLEAPDGPNLTVPSPFRARSRWSVDSGSGSILYWPGHGQDIQVVHFDGSARNAISLPLDDRIEVTSEDREHWFQTGIPSDFRGRRVFEPLRRVARDVVDFPKVHPLLYEVMGGPRHTVWIRRTPNGRNPVVWDVVSHDSTNRILLPAGQRLLGLHDDHAVILTTDDMGRETVELRLVVHESRGLT